MVDTPLTARQTKQHTNTTTSDIQVLALEFLLILCFFYNTSNFHFYSVLASLRHSLLIFSLLRSQHITLTKKFLINLLNNLLLNRLINLLIVCISMDCLLTTLVAHHLLSCSSGSKFGWFSDLSMILNVSNTLDYVLRT